MTEWKYFDLIAGKEVKMSEFSNPIERHNVNLMVETGYLAKQYLLFEPGDAIVFKKGGE